MAQFDKPTFTGTFVKDGKTLTGLEAFQAYRATVGFVKIYNPAGQELDVRGNPLDDGSGGSAAPAFDFAAGMPYSVNFAKLDAPPQVLGFPINDAGHSWWMDAGYGAAEGDMTFTLINKGTGEPIASGNAGIDESKPIAATPGIYQLTVSLDVESKAVLARLRANPTGGASAGYYIWRRKN